jgi:hypothetical protein
VSAITIDEAAYVDSKFEIYITHVKKEIEDPEIPVEE